MARKSTRILATAAVSLLCFGLLSPVQTQAASGGMSKAGKWKYTVPDEINQGVSLQGALVLNPAKRTGFQIFNLTNYRTLIRIFDLDSGKTKIEAVHSGFEVPATRNVGVQSLIHGLDEEANVLYLPILEPFERPGGGYVRPASGNFTGVAGFSGVDGKQVFKMDRMTAYDPSDAVLRNNPPSGPEDVETCASAYCLPQTFGIQPTLMAMEFVPRHVSGGYTKLLMHWIEPAGPGVERNFMVNWLTQWDIDTKRQDFSYRLQSCSVQPPTTRGEYPLSVFQARLGGGLFLGCSAQGAIGQVVRVVMDATTNQPGGENSFPGPINAVDVLADKEGDRVVFRVLDPAGESYWVWSGQAGAYQGIVSSTLVEAPTSSAIDPRTGRLYVMADSNARGNVSRPAALLTTDLRRAPTPQMTYHEDMFIPGVDFAPVIDTAHPSGGSMLWFHRNGASEYELILDTIPLSEDERLSDLDQYTVDVEEQEGVTAANFSGTGHAYGFRSLLAGGLQGMFPLGFDVSPSTGRNTIFGFLVASPCQRGDRELMLGSVPATGLSNRLASAEAAAASSEPGTVADVREPSGRCHPTVLPGSMEEPPRPLGEDADGDGQSQADETLGTEWPFHAAHCAGEGEDEKVTSLYPLDRDPVPPPFAETGTPADQAREDAFNTETPKTDTAVDAHVAEGRTTASNPRDLEVQLQDNKAAVYCSLGQADVRASAEGGAMQMTSVADQIGPISVGAIGSYSNIYRDPERGLVSETVAYARNIKIGAHISIDTAYSRAEAWAGGRPGTAGTSLDRFICGASVPGIAGRVDVLPVDTPAGPLPPDTEPISVGDPLYEPTKDIDNPVDGGKGVSQPVPDIDATDYGADDRNIPGGLALCGEAKDGLPQAGGTSLGQRPFIEALNRALGARGRASMPEPDKDLRQGSFGGYIASIQKDRFEQISSKTVSNDGSTQVPALEIQIFQDDPVLGRGRQLFQFAGVDASVTYGIYLLNPEYAPIDDPNDHLPPGDITDDLVDFTGGPSLPPLGGETPTDSYQPPPGSGGVFEPVRYVYEGISFLTRSWQDSALVGSILFLLAGPLVLIARRRAVKTLT